jgi:hypothetical protein
VVSALSAIGFGWMLVFARNDWRPAAIVLQSDGDAEKIRKVVSRYSTTAPFCATDASHSIKPFSLRGFAVQVVCACIL